MITQLVQLLIKKKKTVVCYRNSGFGDNLFQVACAWFYAKNSNSDLFINWSNSRYLSNKSLNAFAEFFIFPDELNGVKILKFKKIDFLIRIFCSSIINILLTISQRFLGIIAKLNDNIFFRLKNKLFASLTRKEQEILQNKTVCSKKILYIRGCHFDFSLKLKPFYDALKPNCQISKLIDEFAEKQLKDKIVIGVHVRYYNPKMIKSDYSNFWLDEKECLQNIKEVIQKAVEKIGTKSYVIFLATDSNIPFNFIVGNFQNVVSLSKQFGSSEVKELHDELPKETANFTIAEMFLLAKSNILVRLPDESWFSHYASLFAEKIITKIDVNQICG